MAPVPAHTPLHVPGDKPPLHFWLAVAAIIVSITIGLGSLVWVLVVVRRNFMLFDPLAPLYQGLENPPRYLYLARLLNFGRPVRMKSTRLYGLQERLEQRYKRVRVFASA